MTRMRTQKGNVTAAARRRSGSSKRSKNRTGSFPIFDARSARSAIKLRGHAKSRASVLNRAASWARRHKNKSVAAAVKRARSKDRRKRNRRSRRRR